MPLRRPRARVADGGMRSAHARSSGAGTRLIPAFFDAPESRRFFLMDARLARIAEDQSASLFGPDTLVPAQYFDRVGTDAAFQPEKRLMLAVLEEAIATFQRHAIGDTRRSQRLVEDVEEWVSGASGEWPFSFDNICGALDLDADYLRAGMMRWKEAARRKAQQGRSTVYRFPFRRVNGKRHSITGPREYLKKSA
jgi:hypothetical protein